MEKEQLILLVTNAQRGDSCALNALFSEYYNDLYYFALKTVKDDQLALDITQEAFVDILNNIGTLKEPVAFVSWAKKITYHQCTRHFKKRKDIIVDEDEDGNTIFDDLKEESVDFIPDEALDRDDFKKTILSMIDTLSPEQRSAVMMYYFDELSIAQIAEIQGVSEGTVKSRLNYARKAIKQAVEDYEKKNNIKLHAFPFFPFLRFVFTGDKLSLAKSAPAIQGVLPTAAASSSAAGAVSSGAAKVAGGAAKAAVKGASKGAAAKIAAAVLAGTVAIGGATAALMINNNDNGFGLLGNKRESSVVEQTDKKSKRPEKDDEPKIAVYDNYKDIRANTYYLANSGEYEPVNITEANIIYGEKHTYELSGEEFNILGYEESFLKDKSGVVKEFAANGSETDTTSLVLVYKIPCKDEQDVISHIKKDISSLKDLMKDLYNGNEIAPDYKPVFVEEDYKDAVYGFWTLGVVFSEKCKIESGILAGEEISETTVRFNFTGKEEDGQLYYCPKIVFKFKDKISGKWSVGTAKDITTMVY